MSATAISATRLPARFCDFAPRSSFGRVLSGGRPANTHWTHTVWRFFFFFFFLLLSLRRAAAAVANGALEWLVVLSEKGRFKADRDRTKSSLVQSARVAGIC